MARVTDNQQGDDFLQVTSPLALKRKMGDFETEQTPKKVCTEFSILKDVPVKTSEDRAEELLPTARAEASPPSTPKSQMIPDPLAKSEPGSITRLMRSTESERAIRKLIEKRMREDAKIQKLPPHAQRLVYKVRTETLKKQCKIKRLRERRATKAEEAEEALRDGSFKANKSVQSWRSFRSRLERGSPPHDKHLRGPLLQSRKRMIGARAAHGEPVDGEVKEILARWEKSAVVEDAAKAPESPVSFVAMAQKGRGEGAKEVWPAGEKPAVEKPRYDVRVEHQVAPTITSAAAEKARKEKAKLPFISKIQRRIDQLQKKAIQKRAAEYEVKKEGLIQARHDLLRVANQIKDEADALKERCNPLAVRKARKGLEAEMRRLIAKHDAAMVKYQATYDKVATIDRELLALRSLLSEMPTGDEDAFQVFKDEVENTANSAFEDLKAGRKEALYQQQKKERKALKVLQSN
ncbi:hypothetical protein ABW20_dc0108850 [Dactylellina cionopaga]|nr:hypothetical protein ABW20_dc0108850 [Dactylellina cionopaga]